MTIRLRLTLWYTALLGATLILFGVAFYSVLSSSLWAQTQWNMERESQEVAAYLNWQLERDLASMNSPQGLSLPSTQLFANNVGVQIVRLDGMVIARSSNLGSTIIPQSSETLAEIEKGRHHLYRTTGSDSAPLLIYSTPLTVNNRHIVGIIQVIQPVASVENTLNQVVRNLILGTAISLVIAALVGAILARQALAPIQEITETARRITRTRDLGQRIRIDQDVTEVGRLAATFNDMLEQIQQLFRSQRRLTADVSHELRTPLTIIQGNVDLLQRMMTSDQHTDHRRREADVLSPPAISDDTIQEVLEEVESESERMSKMIGEMLLLAQADAGLQLQFEPVEMDTLLLEVYRQTQQVAERRRGAHKLTVQLGSEDQALVLGDRERLRQLLLNLTDNAIKYTPDGGVITLGLEQADGWVIVSVKDTGIGISPEDQALIFDRFYRVDKARSRVQGSSGLGLSIASWIAQAHHGRIDVESHVGKGSRFSVWLPEAG